MATPAVTAAALSAGVSETVSSLDGKLEGNRYNALAAIVRGGKLPGPLTSADCAAPCGYHARRQSRGSRRTRTAR